MTSKLVQMQARFQQKQMQEKEEKLLKLYESQQQRAFERVGRGSAGSNTTISSVGSIGGGKVRQMFDERRQKAGVDKSYPLEPLKSKTRNHPTTMDKKKTTTSRTVVKSTVHNSVSAIKNGKPIINKREVIPSVYNNNDGDETYEEQRYENGDHDARYNNTRSHQSLTTMMDRHNLNDHLDYEEMPQVGFNDDYDEVDNNICHQRERESIDGIGKLPNSEKQYEAVKRNELKLNESKSIGAHASRKEHNNVLVNKVSTRASPSSTKTTTPTKDSNSNSALTTPKTKRTSPMSSNKVPIKPPSTKTSDRAPSTNRPSAKQTPRSAVVRDDLVECSNCGRRFAADRIQKHEDVCTKTGKKKRKVYDATKHRVVGTELEGYVLKGNKKSGHSTMKSTKSTSKKDWRRTHEEFIATIRAAKEAQAFLAKGGKLADLPPPPPSTNPDYVQCPHCGRRFNEAAAERHIPKCANFQFNKPKPNASKLVKSNKR